MDVEFYTLEEINTRYNERILEIFAELEKIMAELTPLVEEILEPIRLWWKSFCEKMREILRPFFAWLDELYEENQRTAFYIRLYNHHFPHWLAERIARYLPRRLLSKIGVLFNLFDKNEQ